jgi:hypothetical protein
MLPAMIDQLIVRKGLRHGQIGIAIACNVEWCQFGREKEALRV